MCINNTVSQLIYPIKRSNNRTLLVGNAKFTLGRLKIANFNSEKTFKITNLQTLISTNNSSLQYLLWYLPGMLESLSRFAHFCYFIFSYSWSY